MEACARVRHVGCLGGGRRGCRCHLVTELRHQRREQLIDEATSGETVLSEVGLRRRRSEQCVCVDVQHQHVRVRSVWRGCSGGSSSDSLRRDRSRRCAECESLTHMLQDELNVSRAVLLVRERHGGETLHRRSWMSEEWRAVLRDHRWLHGDLWFQEDRHVKVSCRAWFGSTLRGETRADGLVHAEMVRGDLDSKTTEQRRISGGRRSGDTTRHLSSGDMTRAIQRGGVLKCTQAQHAHDGGLCSVVVGGGLRRRLHGDGRLLLSPLQAHGCASCE